LYLSFPSSIPGDAKSKPEWVLKGFEKKLVRPDEPVTVSFQLSERDLSYWDDAPGRSLWVCAPGEFRVCVGANSRDAIDPQKGSCTSFSSPCSAASLFIAMKSDAAVPAQLAATRFAPALSAFALASAVLVAAAAIVLRRSLRGYHVAEQAEPQGQLLKELDTQLMLMGDGDDTVE